MSSMRVFRNDGQEMFVDDPGELDRINPGIVLLYADAGDGILYSYFEARVGQPIQATLEYRFDGALDLAAVPEEVRNLEIPNFRVLQAPSTDSSSRRWVLDALGKEPFEISEHTLELYRGVLNGKRSPQSSIPQWVSRNLTDIRSQPSQEHQRLDFAVRTPKAGARFFRTFVEEFEDADITVAVSKSGRINDLSDTDIVIHVDPDRVARDERISPIDGTEELLQDHRDSVRTQRIRDAFSEPVEEIFTQYRNVTNSEPSSKGDAQAILREMLDDQLPRKSGVMVTSPRRLYSTLVIGTLAGLFVGIGLGMGFAQDLEALFERINSSVAVGGAVMDFQLLPGIQPKNVIFMGMMAFAGILLSLSGYLSLRRIRDRPPLSPTAYRRDPRLVKVRILGIIGILVMFLTLYVYIR